MSCVCVYGEGGGLLCACVWRGGGFLWRGGGEAAFLRGGGEKGASCVWERRGGAGVILVCGGGRGASCVCVCVDRPASCVGGWGGGGEATTLQGLRW